MSSLPLTWLPDEKPVYAFCESVTATPYSKWHIRKLSAVGLKVGGGIDTASLCWKVKPFSVGQTGGGSGMGGWDLNVRITEGHLSACCPECIAIYRKETGA